MLTMPGVLTVAVAVATRLRTGSVTAPPVTVYLCQPSGGRVCVVERVLLPLVEGPVSGDGTYGSDRPFAALPVYVNTGDIGGGGGWPGVPRPPPVVWPTPGPASQEAVAFSHSQTLGGGVLSDVVSETQVAVIWTEALTVKSQLGSWP